MPDHDVTAWIQGVNAQSRLGSDAERGYKAVRLESVKRLLFDSSGG